LLAVAIRTGKSFVKAVIIDFVNQGHCFATFARQCQCVSKVTKARISSTASR